MALEGDWVAPAAALEAAGGGVGILGGGDGSGGGGGGRSSPVSSSSSSSRSSSSSSHSSSSSPSSSSPSAAAALMLFPRSAPRAEVPKGHVWVEGDSPERAAAAAAAAAAASGGGGSPIGLGGTPFFLPPQHPCDADTCAGAPVPAALVDGVVRGVLWPAARAGELPPRPARSGRVVRLAAVGGGGGGGGGGGS